MRHQKHGRKFGRKSASRHALMSNLVASLIEHERIRTTDAKAKELRRVAERAISWASSVGTLLSEKAKERSAAERARIVHAMRMAKRVVRHQPALAKLFDEVGPRFAGRAGGYTRVVKVGHRHGDAAPVSIIELIDFVPNEGEDVAPKNETKPAESAPEKKAPKKTVAAKKSATAATAGKKKAKTEPAAKVERAAKPKKSKKTDE